ncbi:hypothetical protein [Candidatus Vidania fulgoroideorum]
MNNICLIGYGAVGREFLKNFVSQSYFDNIKLSEIILRKNNVFYKRRINETINNKIYVKINFRGVFYKKNINIIIELVGNKTISKNILFLSLKKKKILITANKNIISLNYKCIYKYINKRIFIESSVFGGFPFLNNLYSFFKYFSFYKLQTIINGTTNYILYNIFKKNISFNKSLKKAIKNGFSERKPFFDLSGLDIFYKLYIILKSINNNFILKKIIISELLINKFVTKYFLKRKILVKFIGTIKIKNNIFSFEVFPYVLKKKNSFYKLKKEYNIVKIYSKKTGNFLFKGRGAGKNTCFSILNNLYNLRTRYLIVKKNRNYQFDFFKNKIIFFFIKKKKKIIIKKMNSLKVFFNIEHENNILETKNKINNRRLFYLKNNLEFKYFYKIFK